MSDVCGASAPAQPVTPLVGPGPVLDVAARRRYARHLTLSEVGLTGQRRLGAARVLVIGAGGLGSPILQYLVAAGIGRIGVIDPDVVELTNLQRQVLFTEDDLGERKVLAAQRRLNRQNPLVEIVPYVDTLTARNALDLFAGYDVVVDGTDNFATRYLVNDATTILDMPYVWGSILGFDGQISVFWEQSGAGVTYRDVHPEPPAAGSVPNCAEAGVLGMLCGVIGSAMAAEVVKLVLGIGEPLLGRVVIYNSLSASWRAVRIRRNPERSVVTQLEGALGVAGSEADTPDTPGVEAISEILPAELPARVAAGARLIDIREPRETAAGVIDGAMVVPMADLLANPSRVEGGAPTILYCASGKRSASATRRLSERGYAVASLAGGYEAWLADA